LPSHTGQGYSPITPVGGAASGAFGSPPIGPPPSGAPLPSSSPPPPPLPLMLPLHAVRTTAITSRLFQIMQAS
jgi:hypothetical protein